MGRARIFYLDDYRKARQYKSLLAMIELHLAEAVLLGRSSSICCGAGQSGRQRLQLCESGEDGEIYNE